MNEHNYTDQNLAIIADRKQVLYVYACCPYTCSDMFYMLSEVTAFLVGLVQKSHTKVPCTNSISIVLGGFCPGIFVRVGFCPFPPSVTIHLLQQKVKHHFKFHVSYV